MAATLSSSLRGAAFGRVPEVVQELDVFARPGTAPQGGELRALIRRVKQTGIYAEGIDTRKPAGVKLASVRERFANCAGTIRVCGHSQTPAPNALDHTSGMITRKQSDLWVLEGKTPGTEKTLCLLTDKNIQTRSNEQWPLGIAQ